MENSDIQKLARIKWKYPDGAKGKRPTASDSETSPEAHQYSNQLIYHLTSKHRRNIFSHVGHT